MPDLEIFRLSMFGPCLDMFLQCWHIVVCKEEFNETYKIFKKVANAFWNVTSSNEKVFEKVNTGVSGRRVDR